MKKKVTEFEAAHSFLIEMMKKVKADWPGIKKEIENISENRYQIKSEKYAIVELIIAVVATEIKIIKRLYDSGAASRIKSYLEEFIQEGYNEEVLGFLKMYEEMYDEYEKIGREPSGFIVSRISLIWFGDKNAGADNVALGLAIDAVLLSFIGTWKAFREEFEIVQKRETGFFSKLKKYFG